MASFNKVILLGNLTRDPEVRYTPKGTAVTELGMAVNRVYTAENGEKREETTFVDVTLWGRTAEIAGEYLKKGRPVFIEGRLQLDTWDDKQSGQKRSKLKVVGEGLQLIGSRPDWRWRWRDEEGPGMRSSKPAAAPPKQRPRQDPTTTRFHSDSVVAALLRSAGARVQDRCTLVFGTVEALRTACFGVVARRFAESCPSGGRFTNPLVDANCTMTPTEACIALNMLPTMGPVRLRRLLEVFETPDRVLSARRDALRAVEGIGNDVADQISRWEEMVDLPAELDTDSRVRGDGYYRGFCRFIRGNCARFMRHRSCCMSGAT